MIQNINPHKFDLTYGQPKAQDEDFVLYIKKSKTLFLIVSYSSLYKGLCPFYKEE